MKKALVLALVALLAVSVGLPVVFGEHFVNGIEGIKGGFVPPQGIYWRMYNTYYRSTTLRDSDGEKLDVDPTLSAYAFVNRGIWVSDIKLLGADYFADVVIPLVHSQVKMDALGIDDSKFGLGDICVEPFGLSWHGPQYDAAVALGVFIPVGQYDKDNAASPGQDHWTGIATAGGTLYADAERTWSASILARYEAHTKNRDLDIREGQDFHFEWGLGKTLAKVWDVGLAGYCQWQTTKDSGSDALSSDKDRVFAIGPEVCYAMPQHVFFASLRGLYEFGARSRPEGMMGVLTLTKGF